VVPAGEKVDVFERFTDGARQVVVHAQDEARLLRHHYIGTEHLLLGVLREGSELGARVLDRLRIDLGGTRSDIARLIGEGPAERAPEDAEALRAIGIDVDEVRRRIDEAFGPGALDRRPHRRGRRRTRCESVPGHIPFTPRAKKVLELSLREARVLGHNSIGTEHILLGLIREGEGVAARVLEARGVRDREIRRLVAEELERRRDFPGRSA
jgi:ATP-dependent Clp protease ATP-binding subunit ClpA